jgi:hypothetical protein
VLCTMLSGTRGLIWSSRSEIILNSLLGPLRPDTRCRKRVWDPGAAVGAELRGTVLFCRIREQVTGDVVLRLKLTGSAGLRDWWGQVLIGWQLCRDRRNGGNWQLTFQNP